MSKRTPSQVRYYYRNRDKIVQYSKDYFAANKEKIREKSQKRHLQNKERNNAISAAYLDTHRDQINARKRRFYLDNRDRILKEHRDRWAENVEASRAKAKQKYQLHKQKFKIYTARYYADNKNELIRKKRAYQKLHPDLMRSISAKRRALKSGSTVNPDAINQYIVSLKNRRTVRCYWCSSKISKSLSHIDHIIPLSKGGRHEVGNLCTSCADCNWRKHATMPAEWVKAIPGQSVMPI